MTLNRLIKVLVSYRWKAKPMADKAVVHLKYEVVDGIWKHMPIPASFFRLAQKEVDYDTHHN